MAELEVDPLFTQEIVKDFILSNNGKVSNHVLVNHFKNFLNDPQRKIGHRQLFKTYVNNLASIKLDTSGEKVLILRKQFRDAATDELGGAKPCSESSLPAKKDTNSAEIETVSVVQTSTNVDESRDKQKSIENLVSASSIDVAEDDVASEVVETSEGPFVSPVKEEKKVKSGMEHTTQASHLVSKSETNLNKITDEPEVVKLVARSAESILRSSSADELDKTDSKSNKIAPAPDLTASKNSVASEAGSGVVSVKDFARLYQNNNKPEEAAALRPTVGKTKRENRKVGSSASNDSGDFDMTLNDTDREWIMMSANSDYHSMVKMLQSHSYLAKKRDFITGYTALHWACKNGQMDVVKLLCGNHGVDVNKRTQGGYTALHLAAMSGNMDIIQQLVKVYAADPNIRDYGGKTAKNYLPVSADSHIQQLLVPRRVGTSVNTSTSNYPGSRSSRYTTNLSIGNDGKENTSPLPSPVSTKPFRHEDYSLMMPPPRELPPVARKKLLSSQDKPAHSDSETQDDTMSGIVQSGGSTPDVGTIV